MLQNLQPDDIFSRYMFFRSDIDFEKRILKTSAFSGRHDKGFSVFETTNLLEEQIWKIGRKVEKGYLRKNRPMLGRGDLEVRFYQKANLEI